MELIGKLKDEVSQAKDKEEVKEIIENAGMKLTDDELDSVAGGTIPYNIGAKRNPHLY
ncbi:MAG: hypothetical protein K6G09_03210 [Treponema sp.]|nr:hypothetical protein [Treponema sp.]